MSCLVQRFALNIAHIAGFVFCVLDIQTTFLSPVSRLTQLTAVMCYRGISLLKRSKTASEKDVMSIVSDIKFSYLIKLETAEPLIFSVPHATTEGSLAIHP